MDITMQLDGYWGSSYDLSGLITWNTEAEPTPEAIFVYQNPGDDMFNTGYAEAEKSPCEAGCLAWRATLNGLDQRGPVTFLVQAFVDVDGMPRVCASREETFNL